MQDKRGSKDNNNIIDPRRREARERGGPSRAVRRAREMIGLKPWTRVLVKIGGRSLTRKKRSSARWEQSVSLPLSGAYPTP